MTNATFIFWDHCIIVIARLELSFLVNVFLGAYDYKIFVMIGILTKKMFA